MQVLPETQVVAPAVNHVRYLNICDEEMSLTPANTAALCPGLALSSSERQDGGDEAEEDDGLHSTLGGTRELGILEKLC